MLVVPEQIKALFIDFDGVIKESVEVKSDAFEQLFLEHGDDVAKRVRCHHEDNGGMSRFDKLPLYLSWAGETPSEALVESYCERFSRLVMQAVIDSQWVPGAREFLARQSGHLPLFLLTATPQEEIDIILKALELDALFDEVVGAPVKKADAMRRILSEISVDANAAMMIGDAQSDYAAAEANGAQFRLRITSLNQPLQEKLPSNWMFEVFQ